MGEISAAAAQRRAPWYLILPALATGLGVAVPLGYLVARAFDADADGLASAFFNHRHLELLINTALLTVGVLLVTVVIALPAAWLTTRTDLPLRRLFTLAMVLPLAVPAYLMAYTLLAIGGDYGAVAQATGRLLGWDPPWVVPRLTGYWGALVALSVYNFPYMLLNLRAGLNDLDPSLEQVAQSLGRRPIGVFVGVVLPHLRPALLAGSLLIGLHVLTDFGAVNLMQYRTFSFALYDTTYDTVSAARIAILMLAVASALIGLELFLLRGLRLHPAGVVVGRVRRPLRLGRWRWAAIVFLLVVVFVSLILPTVTIAYWAGRSPWLLLRVDLIKSVGDSLVAAVPAAVLAMVLAAPVAYIARRYPSKRSVLLERVSFLGYATPALAFALGLVVVTLRLDKLLERWGLDMLYQSLGVLIYAYALRFLAEAVGPIRAGLFSATPRLEEAARSLGSGPMSTFVRVTLPLMRQGLMVGLALVFLSAMKELPLTILLAPLGFQTLAINVWDHTREAGYADAAPFALMILLLSSLFIGVLLFSESRRDG